MVGTKKKRKDYPIVIDAYALQSFINHQGGEKKFAESLGVSVGTLKKWVYEGQVCQSRLTQMQDLYKDKFPNIML